MALTTLLNDNTQVLKSPGSRAGFDCLYRGDMAVPENISVTTKRIRVFAGKALGKQAFSQVANGGTASQEPSDRQHLSKAHLHLPSTGKPLFHESTWERYWYLLKYEATHTYGC